jgi:hypothetical protein
MPIATDRNTVYGSSEVTNKYSPLANIGLIAADQGLYTGILAFRDRIMRARNMLPGALTLAVPNWAALVAAEAGHAPPLVVVSTNRGQWIADGVNAAATQLAQLALPAFTNENDLRAMTALAGQQVSPPLYSPQRVNGQNRNVYMVVHASEYNAYRQALAGLGITVVGWCFPLGHGPAPLTMVGFGPSRFAAIEFCKQLRRLATVGGVAPWDAAWLLDDNVVAITNFAGFAAVQGALGPAIVCAGFRGGSAAQTFLTNRAWARLRVGNNPAGPLNSNPPGILQQAVLWNIAYLDANFLNFGLPYITSAEDVSIGKYFDARHVTYRYYSGMVVTKEVPTPDGGAPAGQVSTRRRQLTTWVAAQEAAPAPPPAQLPPPPIQVSPLRAGDGGVQLLADYVVNRVLPNSAVAAQQADPATQDTAKSQAVEQITCGAIGNGWIAALTEAAIFTVNGAHQQVVQQRDIP